MHRELLDDVLKHIWATAPTYDFANDAGTFDVFVDQPIAVKIPGADFLGSRLGPWPEVSMRRWAFASRHRVSRSSCHSRYASTPSILRR